MTLSIRPGLLSVTFRKLPAERVVALAVEARLAAIEWGGDVHVPHGDLATARAVRRLCADHGLAVSAYGSYFNAGDPPGRGPSAAAVLDTAAELGADVVRVWPGTTGSAATDEAGRAAVVATLAALCDSAAGRGLIVATEFHAGTLTDDAGSAARLLAAVPGLRTMWQPPNGADPAASLAGLRLVRPWLANLHVFHWWPTADDRRPLADGGDWWPAFLREAADGRTRYASLEFVRGDDVDQFRRDAATLRGWLRRGPK